MINCRSLEIQLVFFFLWGDIGLLDLGGIVWSSPVGSAWIQITANLCIPAHSALLGLRLGSKRPVLKEQSHHHPGDTLIVLFLQDFIVYLIVF